MFNYIEQKVGLSDTQTRELLTKFGYNEIAGRPRQTPLQIFFAQFTSVLVVLLIIASIAIDISSTEVTSKIPPIIIPINESISHTNPSNVNRPFLWLLNLTESS